MSTVAKIRTDRLSHAYLISAPNAAAAQAAALELSQGMVCSAESGRPCRECRDCRKAGRNVHPDIITVERQKDDNGKLRREIYVDQIRSVVRDAYILPMEAGKKVYIIRDAGTMNISAQNAMLKLLEEPPECACFILCTDSLSAMLDTVRSRCVELLVAAQTQDVDEQAAKSAGDFTALCARGSRAELMAFCVSMEGSDNDRALGFAAAVKERAADILCFREQEAGLSRKGAYKLAELAEKAEQYLKSNVGVKHVFGMLAVGTADLK